MNHPHHGRFLDSRGNAVLLGRKIGSGGEGDVFEITVPDRQFVAKIYKKEISRQKQEKLQLMVQGCNEDLEGIAAWPTDVISAKRGGPVCGFIMPRITGFEPVHKVYGPSHRKELYPDADWRFLIRAAKNLAAAFDVIHVYGYAIGDVNEGNILVDERACVRLIDCDSFQVCRGDLTYYCEVGVAQFTPPEIQNAKDFRQMRTANQDNFGLATLIFLLLFMGRHPFAGVYAGKEDMPIERAIAEYRFAFSRNAAKKRMSPPPDSVGLGIVPPDLATMFEEAFSERAAKLQSRPSASDWWKALDTLEKRMRICPADPSHRYYSGLQSCPWCRLERASGIRFFVNRDSAYRSDPGIAWKRVEQIPAPGPLPRISPDDYSCSPEPLPPGVGKALALTKFRHFAAAGVIFTGIATAILLSAEYWEILIILIIGLAIWLIPGKDAAEKKRRSILYDNARYNWALWNRKWKKEAGDGEFVAQYQEMIRLRSRFESIQREYSAALDAIRGPVPRERQLALFLGHCFIDSYPLLRISPNQRAALRSFGIETAADLSIQRLSRIHELNDVSRGILLGWRQQMEKAFVFDPSKGTDKSEEKRLQQRFQPRLAAVEQDMRQGLEKLCQIRQRILNNQARFRPHVEKSAKELAQARADISSFGTGWREWF